MGTELSIPDSVCVHFHLGFLLGLLVNSSSCSTSIIFVAVRGEIRISTFTSVGTMFSTLSWLVSTPLEPWTSNECSVPGLSSLASIVQSVVFLGSSKILVRVLTPFYLEFDFLCGGVDLIFLSLDLSEARVLTMNISQVSCLWDNTDLINILTRPK
jgi:hypothetical protein